MKRLLIIAHTPSDNTKELASALLKGASDNRFTNIQTSLTTPFECKSEHIIAADAVILFTTANFGYMSGALKDLFDRNYYDCIDKTQGKPYVLVIRGGNDGTGAERSVKSITQALKWRTAQKTLFCIGKFNHNFISDCKNVAVTLAASLDNDLI